jgi:flavin reductase (DIM6/NTAB) family NADH-FMN oxidoreductase RutF
MLCRIIGRYPTEQSATVVVRIEDGWLGEPDVPLLYHERSYWKPGDRV